MADTQKAPQADKGKMIKIGIIVVVFGVVGWMAMGMLGGEGGTSVMTSQQPVTKTIPNPDIPKPAKLINSDQPKVMSEREKQLLALQQQTEAKYIAAMNELQMLRVEKEIAVTNKEISAAKLDTIAAQKGIVELLAPPVKSEAETQASYAKGLEQPGSTQQPVISQTTTQQTAQQAPEESYTVVSVSRLQGKWQAVLGAGGRLYHVSVGDVLGAAGTVVIAIDQSGVLLETNGKQRKVSMVPII